MNNFFMVYKLEKMAIFPYGKSWLFDLSRRYDGEPCIHHPKVVQRYPVNATSVVFSTEKISTSSHHGHHIICHSRLIFLAQTAKPQGRKDAKLGGKLV